MSNRPEFRITFSRKDGDEIEFTNYKGEEVSKKYAPLGVLFQAKKGSGFSLAIDSAAEGHKLDPETYWYNVYPTDDDRKSGGNERPARKPARNGKPSQKRASAEQDGDLDFE